MKRLLITVLAALLAIPAAAQQPYSARFAILATDFDLDGEAADDNQVVESQTLADSTAYTLTADPDTCRLVDITVTDTDSSITAGVLTVTGTDCWDYPLIATFTFDAGGTGVKTLTPTAAARASAAYFKTITDVSNALLTGEGVGDALIVGYTSNSVPGYPMYGRYSSTPSDRRRVDPFGSYAVPALVTSGVTSVDVTAVAAASTAPFESVSVGDLLIFNLSGEMFVRKVVTRTDADNVVLNAGVVIPAAGVNFSYKKFYFSTDPQDGWIPVTGSDVVSFAFEVDANVATGGVTSNIECATFLTSDPPGSEVEVEVDTANVASGATGEDVTTIDLRLTPHYTHCRAGVKLGTGDDADAAAENVDLVVGLRR